MAHQGSLAATKDRRKAKTVPGQRPMSNRVDPAVNPMEPSSSHGMPESFPRISKAIQLRHRYNPVLPPGKSRQPMVTSSFCVHTDY
jgi:hypothetical protein